MQFSQFSPEKSDTRRMEDAEHAKQPGRGARRRACHWAACLLPLLTLPGVAATAPASWDQETVPADIVYVPFPYTYSLPHYPTGDEACRQAARYINAEHMYTDPRGGFDSALSSWGCYYDVIQRISMGGGNVFYETHYDQFLQNWMKPIGSCPPGFTHTGELTCRRPREAVRDKTPLCGNPTHVGTRYKSQLEVDYRDAGGLSIVRQYSSWHPLHHAGPLGAQWFLAPFGRHLVIQPDGDESSVLAVRGLGDVHLFELVAAQWQAETYNPDRLERLAVDGEHTWRYTELQTRGVEYYDAQGRLTSLQTPTRRYRLTYGSVGIEADATSQAGLLVEVADQYGRTLQFRYDAQGAVSEIVDPSGASYTYEYAPGVGSFGPSPRLQSVTFPGGSQRRYQYGNLATFDINDPTFLWRRIDLSNRALAQRVNPKFPQISARLGDRATEPLTAITDGENRILARYSYDELGRVLRSEGPLGANAYSFFSDGDTSTTVENPLGKQTTYHFQSINGVRRVSSVEGHPTPHCAGANRNYTYTPEGWLTSKTDWNGSTTTYQYDARGRETQRTEAAGTPDERVITTTWHPEFRLPLTVTEPERIIEYSYDPQGREFSRAERALP